MLFLVVGLVVIVLVILVVVFLSVRSMRADEGSDYPASRTGTDRAADGRRDFPGADRRGNSRRGKIRQGASGRQAGEEWQADRDPGYGEPDHSQTRTMARQDYGDARGYRGHDPDEDEHDPDPGPRRRAAVPFARSAAAPPPRRFGSLPRPRGNQHDQHLGTDGADWPASDWDGVPDEQYWAELSADKPLATTARSAQPGIDARPAAPEPGGGADVTARRAHRDSAPGGPRQESAPTMAAAAPTAPFSATGGPDTDPGIGGPAGWRDTAGDNSPTAAWTARDAEAPGAEETRTWEAEDPLTSPSFAATSAYSTDGRAYRNSHDQPWMPPSHRDDAPGVPDSVPYGGQDDYLTSPVWESTSLGTAAPSFDGLPDGWSGHDYPSGGLEPLPELSGSAVEPTGSWYPAPAAYAQSYPEPSHRSWDQRESRYESGPGHDGDARYSQPSWQGPAPDYAADAGYGQLPDYDTGQGPGFASSGYGNGHAGYHQASQLPGVGDTSYQQPGHDDAGYGQSGYDPGHTGHRLPGHDDAGYGQSGYDPDDTGHRLPGHDDTGYGQSGYDPGDTGYQLPDYGSSDTGYQHSGHGPGSTGSPQLNYDSGDGDYQLPDHGPGGGRYQLPDHGPGDSGYGQSGYDPEGGFDQGPRYGQYSGYDGGRR